MIDTATESFFLCYQEGTQHAPLPNNTLATCTLLRMLLTIVQPAAIQMFRLAPTLRLLANVKGESRKRYTPEDVCGEDVEVAASRLPAHFSRLAGSVEQPDSSSGIVAQHAPPDSYLMLPVPSPPVMCWICGAGLTHNGAFSPALHRRSRWRCGVSQTASMASTAGWLQAFTAVGKTACVAVCFLSPDVIGACFLCFALESSQSFLGRYEKVRGGLCCLRSERLVR